MERNHMAARTVLTAFFALSSIAIVAGCGRPVSNVSVTQNSEATLTTIAPSDYPAAFAAVPSATVTVEIFGSSGSSGFAGGTITLRHRQTLNVGGWAFPAKGVCSAVGLAVDGKRMFPSYYGGAREDVAAVYKDIAKTNVEYFAKVSGLILGLGMHHAYVVCLDSEGTASRNPTLLTVNVHG